MSRSYSQKFLLALNKNDKTGPGVDLGKLCVEYNLPASYVAKVLDVTRMTVYSWFHGRAIRVSLLPKVEALSKLLREDAAAGKLPAKNNVDAKLYLESMIGTSL
jgi:hypothetical protein